MLVTLERETLYNPCYLKVADRHGQEKQLSTLSVTVLPQYPSLNGPPVMDFSSASDDKPKEQLQRRLPKVPETFCGDNCSHTTVEEPRSSTPEMPAVSAFFSLAALAEVAAMENVHR